LQKGHVCLSHEALDFVDDPPSRELVLSSFLSTLTSFKSKLFLGSTGDSILSLL
jgi:hypothetical protein